MKVSKPAKDGGGCFQISSLRWRYLSKQIEGDYPNYRPVVPAVKNAQTVLEIDPSAAKLIIETLEKVPCIDMANFGIGVEIIGRKAELVASAGDGGTPTRVQIEGVKVKGKDVKLALNRQYLAQALSFGLCTVHIIDEMTPLRFSNGGGSW